MRAAVNVLETLATENAVSGVTLRRAATSASPAVPRQMEPSANRIAAETPGRPSFTLNRWRRASRAARASGVALAEPRRRRPVGSPGRPGTAGGGTVGAAEAPG